MADSGKHSSKKHSSKKGDSPDVQGHIVARDNNTRRGDDPGIHAK